MTTAALDYDIDQADAPTEELHLYASLVPGLPLDHPLADCAVVAGQTLLVGGETPAARVTFVTAAADAREPSLELRRFLSLWGLGVFAVLPYAATREERQLFLDHGVVPDQNDDEADDGLDFREEAPMLTTPEATDADADLGEPLDPAIVAALPLQGRVYLSPACEVSPEAEEALLAPWRAAFAARGLEVRVELARVMAAHTRTEQGRRGSVIVADMDRALQLVGVRVWRVWLDKTHPRPFSGAHPELTVKTHQERVLATLERTEGVPLWRLWLGADTELVPFGIAVEVIATRPPSWARTSDLVRRFAADSERALEAKIKARQEAEAEKAAKKAARPATAPTNKTKPGRAGGR